MDTLIRRCINSEKVPNQILNCRKLEAKCDVTIKREIITHKPAAKVKHHERAILHGKSPAIHQ